MVAFTQQWQSCVLSRETVCLTKCYRFAIWPITGKVCQPLLRALLSERKSLFSYIDYCGLKEIRYSKGQSFPFKGLSEKESMGVLGYLFTSYRFSLTFIKNISTQIITLVLSLFGKRDLVSN